MFSASLVTYFGYDISKIPVPKVLRTLEARGVIYVKFKAGYFVSKAKKLESASSKKAGNIKPVLIDAPDVFHEIMSPTVSCY